MHLQLQAVGIFEEGCYSQCMGESSQRNESYRYAVFLFISIKTYYKLASHNSPLSVGIGGFRHINFHFKIIYAQ
jgi:hypothetical protein